MRSLLTIYTLPLLLLLSASLAFSQATPEANTAKAKSEAKQAKKADEEDAKQQPKTTKKPVKKPAATKNTVPDAKLAAPKFIAKDSQRKTPVSKKPNKRWHHYHFPSSSGAIGIDRTMTAEVGVVDTYRLRAALGGFSASDFPVDGADNDFLETSLSLGYTPADFVEVYLMVGGTSNTNTAGRPELIQTQGDVSLGGKFVGKVSPMVNAGGALNLHLLSDVGSGGFAWDATSVEVRGLLSVDLKKTQNDPVRFNVNLGYLIENSENLDNGLSNEPTLVQEFGLQTSRYDRLTIGLGLDVPLDEPVIPFFEYEVALPILVELGRRSDDSNDYGIFSVPHSVALGLRGYPTDNLAIESSIRFGLSDQPYTGVPATAPWMLSVGLAYHLDPRPVVIEKTVEVAPKQPILPPAPVRSSFFARVEDEKSRQPISNVTVVYVNQPLTPQVTGEGGQFQSYEFEAGEVSLQVKAEGYLSRTVNVEVGGPEKDPIVITMKRDPSDKRGKLILLVQNEQERNIPASIQFGGSARDISGRANARGKYEREMKAGGYPVTINARGYEEVTRTIVVKGGTDTQIKIRLKSLKQSVAVATTPAAASKGGGSRLAIVTTKGIKVKKPISFTRGSTELTAEGQRVLRSVARGLKQKKSISKVRIDVHTSGRGQKAEQLRLSRKRAKVIKSFLVSNGVDRKRLRVRGYGAKKLLAPPITKRGRQKNERVELKVLKVK